MKQTEFADDNFSYLYGKMYFTRVENIVGKGEIACYEQFLLFQQCSQKSCTAVFLKVWNNKTF